MRTYPRPHAARSAPHPLAASAESQIVGWDQRNAGPPTALSASSPRQPATSEQRGDRRRETKNASWWAGGSGSRAGPTVALQVS